jgi:hypothetical protein
MRKPAKKCHEEKKMTNKKFLWGMLAILLSFGMMVVGCGGGSGDDEVTFSSVVSRGSAGVTTSLVLTFDAEISGLSASDISLSGVTGVIKGTLSYGYFEGLGAHEYSLPISGFTSNGTLEVAVSKSGYTIFGSPKTVSITAVSDQKSITITGIDNSITGQIGIVLLSPAASYLAATFYPTAAGIGTVTNNSVTAPLFVLSGERITDIIFVGGGNLVIKLEVPGSNDYLWTNGKTWQELDLDSNPTEKDYANKLPTYNITERITTIPFSEFRQTSSSDGSSWTPPSTYTTLSNGVWQTGSFTGNSTERWYAFSVTDGTAYNIWWDDSYQGSGAYTIDVYASAYYSNGTAIFYGEDSAYNAPQSFTASSSGTVYVMVEGYSGTFAIVYSTNITRPGSTFPPSTYTTLSSGRWSNGNIPSSGTKEQWFMFTATASTQYIHATFGTLNDIDVEVYNSYGNEVHSDNLYTNHRYTSMALTYGQVYYIKVKPYFSTQYGTYYITFNTSVNTPPR